jgi:hypothetical protein
MALDPVSPTCRPRGHVLRAVSRAPFVNATLKKCRVRFNRVYWMAYCICILQCHTCILFTKTLSLTAAGGREDCGRRHRGDRARLRRAARRLDGVPFGPSHAHRPGREGLVCVRSSSTTSDSFPFFLLLYCPWD